MLASSSSRACGCFRQAFTTTTLLARLPRRTVLTRVGVSCVGVGVASAIVFRKAHCLAIDDPWMVNEHPSTQVPSVTTVETVPRSLLIRLLLAPISVIEGTYTFIRLTLRCISLAVVLIPIVSTYPLAYRFESAENAWWHMFIWAVQTSGPTFIKFGQWASTRRDVFSKTFCDRLSILHTKTRRQRYFRDCEETLNEVFGADFVKNHKDKVFTKIEPFSIGSGCIAQVYKARVNVPELEKAIGKKFPRLAGKEHVDIAIKVAERGVERQMHRDLSIIRFFGRISVFLVPSLRYVDPMGALDQFEMVLRRQVDLSNEARALERFASNFDAKQTGIRFPVVLAYTKNAIVETFEEGMYINKLVAEDNNPELKSRQSPSVRRRIALLGARALLKMIFVDNFVHGDLHPGNILIRFNDNTETLPGVHRAHVEENIVERVLDRIRSLFRISSVARIRFTDSPYTDDEPTLVLLDTGIAISETPKNLKNLKALFRCMVEKKGYECGELILDGSPKQNCTDRDAFCKQVSELVLKARNENSLRTLNISSLLSQLFTIVSNHKVSLDSSFTSVILSVMVLEGFGRSLDPDLDLFQCARPYLLNVIV